MRGPRGFLSLSGLDFRGGINGLHNFGGRGDVTDGVTVPGWNVNLVRLSPATGKQQGGTDEADLHKRVLMEGGSSGREVDVRFHG